MINSMGFYTKNNNWIHATAVIGINVVFHPNGGNTIGPYVVLQNCHIGTNNKIEAHACIGAPPEIYGNEESFHKVYIGNNNSIREGVTIHSGSKRATTIGNNNLFMVKSHVAHDCIVGNNTKIGGSVFLGGHCVVMDHVFVGGNALLHQFVCVGSYAMIGMGANVNRHVKPGYMVVGANAQFAGMNERILQNYGISQNHLEVEQVRLNQMIERKDPTDGLRTTTKIYE